MLRIFIFFFILTGTSLISVQSGSAQVVVYKIDFEQEGSSINYNFYEDGWVVADATGGPASWILTFFEGPLRRYITITDFGSLFYANKGNSVKAVLSASASNGTPQTTFLAIGTPSQTVRKQNIKVEVANQLEGVTSSADDESELPFDVKEGDKGFAGFSKMKASLQRSRTDDANSNNLSVEETFAELILSLERRGYTPFVVAEPATSEDSAN
ncbi:MAG: hypothetical protein QM496_08510 [Verrucomicrobiota bacterium]